MSQEAGQPDPPAGTAPAQPRHASLPGVEEKRPEIEEKPSEIEEKPSEIEAKRLEVGVKRAGPYFTGVTTYRDPHGRYSVRYPTDWQPFALDGREGMMFVPDPGDMHTALSAWVSPLEHAVVAEDVPDLRAGVDDGLRALPECVVESASDEALDDLIRFERIYTFRQDGATRKRKLWLLFASRWQIALLWQGSSVPEYEYWFAMANYSFHTFELPGALLFATDRRLAGRPPAGEQ